MKIGIAITTFNRAKYLMEQINLIRDLSVGNYELIVCDDGSSDNTIDLLEKEKIPYIAGENRGIAWNKNRGIYYLINYTPCDVFILLDDDIRPTMYGWNIEWGEAAQRYGHINYLAGAYQLLYGQGHKDKIVYGNCNAKNPGLFSAISGPCISFNRNASSLVGYMDNRFGAYGHEHTDFSNRFIKAGFGGIIKKDKKILYAVMNSGLERIKLKSSGSAEEANKNISLLEKLSKEPIFRLPWFNDQEQQEFLQDFKKFNHYVTIPEWDIIKNFNAELYMQANNDLQKANVQDPLKHYLTFGRYENRKLQ